MGIDNKGVATCSFCGSQIGLFTIFNRDMQGLARAWKRRHQRGCEGRTPEQRRAWARTFLARGDESSITVDLDHEGFALTSESNGVGNRLTSPSDDQGRANRS